MDKETLIHVLEEKVNQLENKTDETFKHLFNKMDTILNKIIDIEKRLNSQLPNWASIIFALYSAALAGLLVARWK